MLIGLISDTHIAFSDKVLPPQIKDIFRGVDLILHAGDIWIPSVLDELESIAPVVAAWGDDDLHDHLGSDERMVDDHLLPLDGSKLWLTHIRPRYALLNPNIEIYSPRPDPEDIPDVVVYGHTHFATVDTYKGVLMVNPGSPTVPNYVPTLGTVALLTLDNGEAEAKIVSLK